MSKFRYTGKALTNKEVEESLERIRLKPRAIYDIDKTTGKFCKRMPNKLIRTKL